MERILSVEQMKKADEFTINTLGISSEDLVVRAGTAVADEIYKRLKGGRVLVCIGKGNNGADGRVVAEVLSRIHGFTVATLNVSNGIFKLLDKDYDIIVDCIFGTGLNKPVEGKYKLAIEKINQSGAYVVSCDIPSGLNGNTGIPMGIAVKANLTVAIQEYKLGHFLNDGPDYCGQVVVKDIGISVWGEDYFKRLNDVDLEKFFPERKRNVNKGSFGKTCVIGGSKSYPGSAVLSLLALTALKMGNGYSNLAIPDSIFDAVSLKFPELTVTTLKSDGDKILFDQEKLSTLLKYNAISFGMGVGVTKDNYQTIKYLLENYNGKLLIDADGLNTLSTYGVGILKDKKCDVILTPHIKEFSRLISKETSEIISQTVPLAVEFAKEYDVTLVLKSSTTVITDGNEFYLNTSGCSGLAKAGSGDILSGIICGLLAGKQDAFDCAVAGCYLFGLAGEKASKNSNDFCMTATDVISALPKVISKII